MVKKVSHSEIQAYIEGYEDDADYERELFSRLVESGQIRKMDDTWKNRAQYMMDCGEIEDTRWGK